MREIHDLYEEGNVADLANYNIDDVLYYLLNVVALKNQYDVTVPEKPYTLFIEPDASPTEGFTKINSLQSVIHLSGKLNIPVVVTIVKGTDVYLMLERPDRKSPQLKFKNEGDDFELNNLRRMISLFILKEHYGLSQISYEKFNVNFSSIL